MNLDRSRLAVLATMLAATWIATGCGANEGDASDSSEGAQTAQGAASCGTGYKEATAEAQELRMAPIFASTCASATEKMPKGEEKDRAVNKCLVYSNHSYFKPIAGHVAVDCLLKKGTTGRALSAIETKACGDEGLYSICGGEREPASQAWCKGVVASTKLSDPGNGAIQRCNWVASGLAEQGLKEMQACVASSTTGANAGERFNTCLDGLGMTLAK